MLLPFAHAAGGPARTTKGTLMEGNCPKAPTQQDLLKALGFPVPRSNDEIAEQQVKEWQQEAVKAIRDVFARMRRHLDAKSAVTAGEIGHHELNQATTKRMALWQEQERAMVAKAQSHEIAEETRKWLLRQLERGEVDIADPLPKLAVWRCALGEIAEDTFCDTDDDAAFRECLQQIVKDDAKKTKDAGNLIKRLLGGPDYAELLRACGLPAEPAANVRDGFDMAVRLIQRGRAESDAAAAVALAAVVGRAGGQNVRSLPFGYDGPRVEHEGWLRREDLTRWLTQLGGLVVGGRLNADSARLAVEYAIREYWLRAEQFDEWQPGMKSGSGWIEVIQPQAAGIARAAQMAAEPAAAKKSVAPMDGLSAKAADLAPTPASMTKTEADGGTPGETKGESRPESPTGYLGGASLADALGIHATRRDAFFRQLERQRVSLGDDSWHEVRNPRPNNPRFLYRADSPKVCAVAAAYKKSKSV